MRLNTNFLFVGRELDLRTLAQALKGGETIIIGQSVAITGMGGLGKTQLAVEFVHRYGQYFDGGVFWLTFANADTVRTEIAACGGMDLHPAFSSLSLEDQVRSVETAWHSPVPRLLIFDNCEDEDLLARYRPASGGSRVLVTSRRAQWDVTLGVHTLPLGVLHRSDSVDLLRCYRPDLLLDDPDLHTIANELGDLPLALTLAGRFLQLYQHDMTPAHYVAELRATSGVDHESLDGEGISPTGHDQSVARTFRLSYDRLDPTHPTDALAQRILVRAAYFAPGEPIPRDVLKATVGIHAENQSAMRQATKALQLYLSRQYPATRYSKIDHLHSASVVPIWCWRWRVCWKR